MEGLGVGIVARIFGEILFVFFLLWAVLIISTFLAFFSGWLFAFGQKKNKKWIKKLSFCFLIFWMLYILFLFGLPKTNEFDPLYIVTAGNTLKEVLTPKSEPHRETLNGFYIENPPSKKYVSISGSVVKDKKVIEIPSEINGKKVVSINFQAFSSNTNLETITIPQTVESIGSWAFMDCSNLKQVKLNEGLKVIEDGAFSGCVALEEINLPDSLEEIGEWAFSGCEKIIQNQKKPLKANNPQSATNPQ